MATASTPNAELASKGKARAKTPDMTNERTPLLQPQTSSQSTSGPSIPRYYDDPETSIRARQRLWSRLTCVFLISLVLCIFVFLLLFILAYSYATRLKDVSPEDIMSMALKVEGPDNIEIREVTPDGSLWVNLEARVGIDAGSIIGVNTGDDEGTIKDVWKSIGRWGVHLLDRVSVSITTINVTSIHDPFTTLASISPSPISIPVTTNPPPDFSWLTPISVSAYVVPTQNMTALTRFIADTWSAGAVSFQTHIAQAVVRGGGLNETGWRHQLKFERQDLDMDLAFKIPPLPGLPPPGHNTPFPSFSQLVTLQSFDISTKSQKILLQAKASLINPAPPTFSVTCPRLPFIISLPSVGNRDGLVPVATVHSYPFTSTHPNISLLITGSVLPLPTSASTAISAFVSRYLSLDFNPIMISTPLFPSLVIDTDFPPPKSKPQVMRNVTIHNMSIKPHGTSGEFLASGTVYARIVLPRGMNFDLDVNRVFPDVLVFDGEVPPVAPLPLPIIHNSKGDVPNMPLPNPLPDRAIAHIRPDNWLLATSTPDETDGDEGSAFAATANLVDVPLEVLPGRQKQFSNFVGKVIFGSGGALAGLQGSVAVGVYVHGIPFNDGKSEENEMELIGLPFQGSVRVGKKTFVITS